MSHENPSNRAQKRVSILLYNMGGPASLEDVNPFLQELFSDNDIIDMPGPALLQNFVAEKIARKRTHGVKEKYAEIGGGSPQLALTQKLSQKLFKALQNDTDLSSLPFHIQHIEPLMRYTQPRAQNILERALEEGSDELWLLSQYPHCSRATTGTSLRELGLLKAQDSRLSKLKIRSFAKYGNHTNFLDLWANRIRPLWESLKSQTDSAHLIVSAHSLPVQYVAQGDPYRDQILSSAYNVMSRLGLEEGRDWSMAWQSAVGPVRWLAPDTRDVIKECSQRGKKHLLVWPVAFVSDHIETLHEIDIEFADLAKECGIAEFKRVPNLNTDDDFSEFLCGMIKTAARELSARGSTQLLRDIEQSPSGEGCHLQTGGCLCGRYFQAGLSNHKRGLPPARLEFKGTLPPKK